VQYAGLERATNTKAGDPRSDIYFLGCTFHEMVTGRPLLVVKREDRNRLTRERFELEHLLKRDDPDLPPPIHSLISRMVAFDPTRRFQNYDQVLDAIQQVRAELSGGGKTAASHGPKTVFVVEHNPKFQGAFREKLKARGYRVLISINATQAVIRFRQSPYHALIVNCATAERPGLEAFEAVMREAELNRIDCAGLLIVSPDQVHWTEPVKEFPRAAILTMPASMKQIVQKLSELAPTDDVSVADGQSD
jgi:CheY-like chemotaxis protein